MATDTKKSPTPKTDTTKTEDPGTIIVPDQPPSKPQPAPTVTKSADSK